MKKLNSIGLRSLLIVANCSLFANMSTAETTPLTDGYPAAGQSSYPDKVYWGDTHLHTNWSRDAYLANQLGPDEAYRFAKGESVKDNNGVDRRLRRPLDFLVVADHAERIGLFVKLAEGDPLLVETEQGRLFSRRIQQADSEPGGASGAPGSTDLASRFQKLMDVKQEIRANNFGVSSSFRRSVWADVAERADRHNDPGKFTAFSGFEWTPPTAGNMKNGVPHRVVVFRDAQDKVSQVMPFSAYDSDNPEDLWRYLDGYHKKTGGDALAILHNSNLSFGNNPAFATWDFEGQPLSRDYAISRQRWEPLVEATQNKGDSETHPLLSPTDEFADFERWRTWLGNNYDESKLTQATKAIYLDPVQLTPDVLKYKYVRSALALGLNQQVAMGVNPFKFGLIGSTDNHRSLAVADNDNFWDPGLEQLHSSVNDARNALDNADNAAAGYAAVWAEENTREALFAAMKRKEVYASTGPRMTVRLFGGWEYEETDALRPDLAEIGYRKGVPMGGDLSSAPMGKNPRFLIRAVKDPDGANLDRVQVIKGWRSADGALHEKVYDVALSNGRKAGRNGKVKPVGNTVDIIDASYTNSIGDPELAVVWRDPDFNPDELAFYYVRVLEIPTPRWTAYRAKALGIDPADIPDNVTMVTQERAYTSPIWYSPE